MARSRQRHLSWHRLSIEVRVAVAVPPAFAAVLTSVSTIVVAANGDPLRRLDRRPRSGRLTPGPRARRHIEGSRGPLLQRCSSEVALLLKAGPASPCHVRATSNGTRQVLTVSAGETSPPPHLP
jgi:hypothetical protein